MVDIAKSKYARYCIAVTETRIANPYYRRGQAHYNVLHDFDPEYAELICNTALDPFYDDAGVQDLLSALVRRWDGQ